MAAEQGVEVDEAGFRRLMTEQRQRAKADARAKKSAHGDTSVYRARRRLPRPRRRVHRLPGGHLRGAGLRPARGRRVGRVRPRRARTSSWSWTGRRSTPRAAASSPTAAGSSWPTARRRGARRAVADQGPDRAPRQRAVRRGQHRHGRARARRHRPAPGDLAGPHRDAHGAQGDPRGARRHRDAGGLGERAGPVPVRLQRAVGAAGVGAVRRRGQGQRAAARGPAGARRDHDPAAGPRARGDGAVRREVRRRGARRLRR